MQKNIKILISEEELQEKVTELGEKLSKDYENKELLVISLLKGSFIFTADLVRRIKVPTQIEFITTSSYGNRQETSGKVDILSDLRIDIKGRDVLVVDDIVDSGLTMKVILEYLKIKEPNSLKSCVLLDKPDRRQVDIKPDYVGFTIPDLFIVGYGLNYGNYYRNIPYIFTFEKE